MSDPTRVHLSGHDAAVNLLERLLRARYELVAGREADVSTTVMPAALADLARQVKEEQRVNGLLQRQLVEARFTLDEVKYQVTADGAMMTAVERFIAEYEGGPDGIDRARGMKAHAIGLLPGPQGNMMITDHSSSVIDPTMLDDEHARQFVLSSGEFLQPQPANSRLKQARKRLIVGWKLMTSAAAVLVTAFCLLVAYAPRSYTVEVSLSTGHTRHRASWWGFRWRDRIEDNDLSRWVLKTQPSAPDDAWAIQSGYRKEAFRPTVDLQPSASAVEAVSLLEGIRRHGELMPDHGEGLLRNYLQLRSRLATAGKQLYEKPEVYEKAYAEYRTLVVQMTR